MIEHCISLFKKEQEEKAYRAYMADVGYALANMFGKKFCGFTKDIISKRFAEIVEPAKEEKVESEEEIIARINKKLGGK